MSGACDVIAPGHQVAFEQIAEAGRYAHRVVERLEVVGEDALVLTLAGGLAGGPELGVLGAGGAPQLADGERVQVRYHEAWLLREVWEHRTGTVTWNPTVRVLAIVARHPWEGCQYFHLADGGYAGCGEVG